MQRLSHEVQRIGARASSLDETKHLLHIYYTRFLCIACPTAQLLVRLLNINMFGHSDGREWLKKDQGGQYHHHHHRQNHQHQHVHWGAWLTLHHAELFWREEGAREETRELQSVMQSSLLAATCERKAKAAPRAQSAGISCCWCQWRLKVGFCKEFTQKVLLSCSEVYILLKLSMGEV